MTFHGSCLTHPIAPSVHGTLATSGSRAEIIAQSIASIIETRQGERVMVPDYGIPDFVFAVMDAGFTARVGHFITQQVKRYEPLVDKIRVTLGVLDDADAFIPGFVEEQQRAALQIVFTERGSNTPHNLVYPTWRLRA
ncbi:MAG TPA: GPW/gp25 family protein [Pyrinomonadaceae bacterium]|nr:GPW/gp25 family protein [Pyrinomonadaceae bacterium]